MVYLHPDLVLDKYDDATLAQTYFLPFKFVEESQWSTFHKKVTTRALTKYEAAPDKFSPLPPFDDFLKYVNFQRPLKAQPVLVPAIKAKALASDLTPRNQKALEEAQEAEVIEMKPEEKTAILPRPVETKSTDLRKDKERMPVVTEELREPAEQQDVKEEKQKAKQEKQKEKGVQEEVLEIDARQQPSSNFNFSQREEQFISDVFGAQGKFVPIKYDDFKRFWEKTLGGKVFARGNGGSHRSLVWRDQIIGKIFEPHKIGQGVPCFGKRMISVLRDALEAVGIPKPAK